MHEKITRSLTRDTQCLAQQDAPAVELPDVECRDVDCVEPLRPSKDGNSSSASSSGSGRLSPLSGDIDMKQNSAAVEQMILASSRSSRQAMGNLRSGSQPFAPLQKDVKENVMVRKPSAAAATSPAAAHSSAAVNAQLPKSRSTFLKQKAAFFISLFFSVGLPFMTAAAARMMRLCRRLCGARAALACRTNQVVPAAFDTGCRGGSSSLRYRM